MKTSFNLLQNKYENQFLTKKIIYFYFFIFFNTFYLQKHHYVPLPYIALLNLQFFLNTPSITYNTILTESFMFKLDAVQFDH